MKKVGILTINDYNNYGNRLQNYATQELLKAMGLDVKTVVNITKIENENGQNRSKLNLKSKKIKHMPLNEIYKK